MMSNSVPVLASSQSDSISYQVLTGITLTLMNDDGQLTETEHQRPPIIQLKKLLMNIEFKPTNMLTYMQKQPQKHK